MTPGPRMCTGSQLTSPARLPPENLCVGVSGGGSGGSWACLLPTRPGSAQQGESGLAVSGGCLTPSSQSTLVSHSGAVTQLEVWCGCQAGGGLGLQQLTAPGTGTAREWQLLPLLCEEDREVVASCVPPGRTCSEPRSCPSSPKSPWPPPPPGHLGTLVLGPPHLALWGLAFISPTHHQQPWSVLSPQLQPPSMTEGPSKFERGPDSLSSSAAAGSRGRCQAGPCILEGHLFIIVTHLAPMERW